MSTAVKICCIQSIAEARLAIDHGASAIGLVGAMPSGPGPISDTQIRDIAASVGQETLTVLLTSEVTAEGVLAHVGRTRPRAVQLVDAVDPLTYARLANEHPDTTVIQVIHVRGPSDIEDAKRAADRNCNILLDSGAPDAAVKQLGGTGRTHNWALSREIVEAVATPVWLAGGLHPGNVAEAIRMVGPHGVDLCSGLRPSGSLDPELLAHFMSEVRAA